MKINIKETAVFAMLGTLMYASKVLMQALPNIHLLGMLIMTITLVYRAKALYPIYIYVFLEGLMGGFSTWWIPYLYVWTVLWGVTMLLPKNMPNKVKPIIYIIVCALHGFLFGVLYAPVQAIVFGLDFKGMIAWIAAGFTFDVIHGISNLLCGTLICPLVSLLKRIEKITQ
ncbi:MAG: hypothetical protein IJM97_07125 [Clostridia bacterium]|nr:hypothetical protein [Clostridia bacterium]